MDGKADLKARLGARCKELRKRAGLSQIDIIRNFDFGLSHYQKLERGNLDPRLSTLVKLADVYGVSLSELVEGL